MWDLSDRVHGYVVNPKHAGVLADANAIGELGGMSRGDAYRLMLKIDPKTDVVIDARFQTFGCGLAIASCAAVTEMVIGQTVEDVSKITNADISALLGGVPQEKMYCSVMGCETLRQAIARYRSEEAPADRDDDMLCACCGLGVSVIARTIRGNKLTSPEDVKCYTRAGCPACATQVAELIARVNAEMVEDGLIAAAQAYRISASDARGFMPRPPMPGPVGARPPHIGGSAKPSSRPAAAGAAAKPTSPEKIMLIKRAIDDLRPHLQRDGGDCELVDVEDNTVFVKLSGNCVGCQLASVTISGVQDRLVEKLGLPLRIMPVQ